MEFSDLMATADRARELTALSAAWPSWTLTDRQLCDLELLLTGGFAPLAGFLCQPDYDRVVAEMRLADGRLWPIPITLDLPEPAVEALEPGGWLALRDVEGTLLAAMRIEAIWLPDRALEAARVYETSNPEHPGVAALLRSHPVLVGGSVEGLHLPTHHDCRDLRKSPGQVRAEIAQRGWSRVVAFQTRNPLHRAHVELTLRAAREHEAKILLHPVVGMTKPGDVDHFTRVRAYRHVMRRYPEGQAMLAVLPLAMRMAGPREALWHALIRKNHGCTHFIVGRDHAGPGADSRGKPYYDPYAAQELLRLHAAEAGIEMVPFRQMVYVPARDAYFGEDEVPDGLATRDLSGTELRRCLEQGLPVPEWFTYPEVAAELAATHPPKGLQGFTVFFTGLSGAGKSTLANALLARLLERGGRRVTLLDGDHVRRQLSSELGFSREHRDLNIRRIGYVAAEVTRHGGIALCAPIAPFDSTRKDVRREVSAAGGFVLVHVATPIATCEARDRKGLYAKARAGLVPQFTGVSDPYETPADAELVLDMTETAPTDGVERILEFLVQRGYLR